MSSLIMLSAPIYLFILCPGPIFLGLSAKKLGLSIGSMGLLLLPSARWQ